jgi:hypothetical protein
MMALPASTTAPVDRDQEVDPADQQRREVVSKAGVNVWLMLYQAERKHLVDVCQVAINCGIEERRVKLAEQRGPSSRSSSSTCSTQRSWACRSTSASSAATSPPSTCAPGRGPGAGVSDHRQITPENVTALLERSNIVAALRYGFAHSGFEADTPKTKVLRSLVSKLMVAHGLTAHQALLALFAVGQGVDPATAVQRSKSEVSQSWQAPAWLSGGLDPA